MAVTIDPKHFGKYTNMTLNNVAIQWPHVYTPDTAFNKNQWQVEAFVEGDLKKELEGMGFKLRDSKDGSGRQFLRCIRKVAIKSGTQKPPLVVGPDSKPFSDPIGNGTICNIAISVTAYKMSSGPVICAYLDEMQIVSLEDIPSATSGDDGDTAPRKSKFSAIPQEDNPFA